MKFNVTVDKRAEAVIDRGLCINCGECREICPTGAVHELQKTVVCMNAGGEAGSFPSAAKRSVEMACSGGCPLGIVPQTVAAFVEKGELESAAEHIWAKNPMPAVCAAVCEHICQDACKRIMLGDAPLNMKALEGYVLDNTEAAPFKYPKRYHEKIAVIGGGPAGLSAAYHVASAGFGVTIFEKDNALGGALRWGIPAFRLDKKMVAEEIDRIVNAGIKVRFGWHIGADHSLDELWKEGFSACIIAAGESYGVMPGEADMPGIDGIGVYDGVKIMRQITGGEDEGAVIGDAVVVVGGGGFAADLTRVLRRMGKEVLCVAEESADDLMMDAALTQALEDEGAELRTATAVGQIITESGRVKAVELVKIDHIEDERGRLKAHRIKGSGLNHFCDTVVFALGQKSFVQDICNAETYPNGKIKIDDSYKTNKEKVFACGDVTGETSSVVEALAAGKEAAEEVCRVLSGSADISGEHEVYRAPAVQAIYPANVRRPAAQHEEMIIEAALEEEDPFPEVLIDDAGPLLIKPEHTEEILAVLRSAGITEEPLRFEFDENAKKAAVIGGGIAGITAAISLAKKGYRPTIFEKMPALGGSYRWLATEKRIDKSVLISELKKVENSGIDVVCGVTAGAMPTVDELFRMGYDAVLFAIGEHGGDLCDFVGADLAGVYEMASLMGILLDNEVPVGVGNKVLVAGDDELTFDMARRLNEICEEVTVLAPWSKGSLQAKTGAVDAALEEGVNLVTGVEVTAAEGKDGRAYNAVCKVAEKGYTINVPCDTLVVSGGPDTQTIAIRNLKLDMKDDGHIEVDHRLAASIPGVYSIGGLDMSAADAGRAGAAAVENRLTGNDSYISIADPEKAEPPRDHEMIEGRRPEAIKGFEAGKKLLTCGKAMAEASRCMGCGYHSLKADLCMGCGICAKICPAGAIEMKPVGENKEVQSW